MEYWKSIDGSDGLYEISNLGRVKSFKSGIERFLKGSVGKFGHSIFCLNLLGKQISCNGSRLVALHFIPNPNNLPLVCHKDENLDKNGALYNGEDNLFWGTRSDNMKDMWRKGRQNNHFQNNHPNKGKIGNNHHSSKKVNQYTKCGEFIKEWGSIGDVKRELGINIGNISSCCNGKINIAGGFKWSYTPLDLGKIN